MTQEQQAILQAVLADDSRAFARLVGKRERNLCYGRFPLLSLCYWYNSRRILRGQLPLLRRCKTYEVCDEPEGLFVQFARKAGRATRLWTSDKNSVITPLEMLAVTGRWHRLRHEYKASEPTPEETERLLSVVQLAYNKPAQVRADAIVLPAKRLPYAATQWLRGVVAIAVVAVLVLSTALGLGISYQNNTLRRVFNIENEQQLTAALASDKEYRLTQDMQLTLDDNQRVITGTLDGDGHTLTLVCNAPIKSFDGKWSNMKVVLVPPAGETTIDTDRYALWANEMTGTVENVEWVLSDVWQVAIAPQPNAQAGASCAVGVLCGINRGVWKDCSLTVQTTCKGVSNVNAFAGSYAAQNFGTIQGCQFHGSLVCDTVDVGGMVGANAQEGNVDDCMVNATVSQTTAAPEWSPHCGGVVGTNYGTVRGCTFGGTAACSGTYDASPLTEVNTAVYAGGVVGINYGTIDHCVTTGTVQAQSAAQLQYTGGIVGVNDKLIQYNDNQATVVATGRLQSCIVTGAVKSSSRAVAEGDTVMAMAFVGGVAGHSAGYVLNVYWTGTATLPTQGFTGALLGRVDYDTIVQNGVVDVYYKDFHYWANGTFASGVGATYSSLFGQWMTVPDTSVRFVQTSADKATIVAMEGYWYGK